MPAATAKKLAAQPLKVGDVAPDFTMPADDGRTLSLKALRGKQNIVLYFYPKDDTPGCTTEAKDFRDLVKDFAFEDTIIIGVSKDDIKSHCKFRDKYELSFALASDKENDTCEKYGVWGEKSMYGKTYMGIVRSTFLIDLDGTIAAIWPKVSVTGHAKEVLQAAKDLAK